MSNNFWDKMFEDFSKPVYPSSEATDNALKEATQAMYTLYKNLIEEGFKPNEALYLLGELIKGGIK